MFMVYVDVARNLIGVKFSEIDLSSKVFIVTGCNTGIGQCKETITGIHSLLLLLLLLLTAHSMLSQVLKQF
jgi:hypothetical protein